MLLSTISQALDKHCLAVSSKSHSLGQVPRVLLLSVVNKTEGGGGTEEIQPFVGKVSGRGKLD